jgi:hypothetical protein
MIRQTHTYVNLEISQAAFDEIEGLLKAAKYDHLLQDGKVMMEGIALIPPEQPQENDPEDPKCDVCGDTAEQHRTEKGYDHEFGGIEPLAKPIYQERTFAEELTSLINRFSRENASDTPDFIVAAYVSAALEAFENAVNAREKWYGREPVPVPADQCPTPPDVVGKPFLTSI